MRTLTEYIGSNDDYENLGTSATGGQSFQVLTAGNLQVMSFYGGRGNTSSGTFKFEVKTGSTAGTVIATTGTLNSSTLTAHGTPEWNEINFVTPVLLAPNITYYLVMTALSGSINDEVRWSVDTTSASYAYGSAYTGTTAQPTRDRNFALYQSVTSWDNGNKNSSTFSNLTKNIPTFANINKTLVSYSTWDSSVVQWDGGSNWDATLSFTNQDKN